MLAMLHFQPMFLSDKIICVHARDLRGQLCPFQIWACQRGRINAFKAEDPMDPGNRTRWALVMACQSAAN